MNKSAANAVADTAKSRWLDETLWIVRSKRDARSKTLPEWEALRDAAHDIKQYSYTHLPELLEQFEANAVANGAIVHWAADAREYCEIIGSLLREHGVKRFVKSKSMLSEECGLREYLQEMGIEAIETDLGERIIQLMGTRPSHIVLPAIHVKKEEVAELFQKYMPLQMQQQALSVGLKDASEAGADQTFLTHVARRSLRELFLSADAAMTGGNFAVASTGEVVVCTNEGNADMGTSCAPLQIAAFGIDKIIPDRRSLGVFTRLLARSATGQASTAYTTHYSAPIPGREFHIVIVDNGRSRILADANHRKLLGCLRCGACMNTCPVFRRIGGYSYSYFIPGPLGINLGMTADPQRFKDNLSLCSLCHSCSLVCPGKVDPASQIYAWRQDYHNSVTKKMLSGGMNVVMKHPMLLDAGLAMAPWGMKVLKSMGLDWGKGREMPDFQKQTKHGTKQ